jgi:hypothetical protein
MQLMGDAVTVLGGRFGMAWDPVKRAAYLVRHGNHPGLPFTLRAGIRYADREIILPLAPDNPVFDFHDQECEAARISLSGIDPVSGLHIKLAATIPFRPRDEAFSTVPCFLLDLSLDRLVSPFRWKKRDEDPLRGRLFLEIHGIGFKISLQGQTADIFYQSPIVRPRDKYHDLPRDDRLAVETITCRDRLIALDGILGSSGYGDGCELVSDFNLAIGQTGPVISLAWCAYDPPVLEVMGERCEFAYTQRFHSLEAVADWAFANADEIRATATTVSHLIQEHSLGYSVSKLMAYSLHAWLANTWWVRRGNGQDWFTVWEGSCYFHSTVDVEYTQAPFYLSVWPELLELELDEWPHFSKDGSLCLGEAGHGTCFLSHDIGIHGTCDRQYYPHDMEVEENANYLLMAFAHWRRTGRETILQRHSIFMRRLMDFIIASASSGDGVPDRGCANTIDDASPAIQFGRKQTYLGIKAIAALLVGAEMLERAGMTDVGKYRDTAGRGRVAIEAAAWLGDHYSVCL